MEVIQRVCCTLTIDLTCSVICRSGINSTLQTILGCRPADTLSSLCMQKFEAVKGLNLIFNFKFESRLAV